VAAGADCPPGGGPPPGGGGGPPPGGGGGPPPGGGEPPPGGGEDPRLGVGDEPPAGGVPPPRVGGAPLERALAVVVGFGLTGVGAGAFPEPGSGVGAFWPSAEGDAAAVPVLGAITGLAPVTGAPGERDGSWAAAKAAGSARGDVDVLAGAGLADRALQPDRVAAAAAATPASATAARTRGRPGQKLPLTIPQIISQPFGRALRPGLAIARTVPGKSSNTAHYQPVTLFDPVQQAPVAQQLHSCRCSPRPAILRRQAGCGLGLEMSTAIRQRPSVSRFHSVRYRTVVTWSARASTTAPRR
jgi:hypothetical protein